MKNRIFRNVGILAVLALVGCGNLSKVDDQGRTDQAVWPDVDRTTFETGSYPEIDSLHLVRPGMSKDQLYNLLGRPHFGEGLAGVREWDYLFHFRTTGADMSCQYKVLFDKNKRAQTFMWKPAECADVLSAARR